MPRAYEFSKAVVIIRIHLKLPFSPNFFPATMTIFSRKSTFSALRW
jgi:hypothetical protein